MDLLSKKPTSVEFPCALCTKKANISDGGVHLTFCCENPICSECSSKPLTCPTFCLICCRSQRLSNGGILYSDKDSKYIYPDEHWRKRKEQIEAFFAKARTMPGCSFFFSLESVFLETFGHTRDCRKVRKILQIYVENNLCALLDSLLLA